LDATVLEESAAGHRIILLFSFADVSEPRLHGMRMLGPSEITLSQLETLVVVSIFVSMICARLIAARQDAQQHARKLKQSLDAQLKLQELGASAVPSIYTLR